MACTVTMRPEGTPGKREFSVQHGKDCESDYCSADYRCECLNRAMGRMELRGAAVTDG